MRVHGAPRAGQAPRALSHVRRAARAQFAAHTSDGQPSGEYKVVLNVPPGISCERCVLQWYYQTANSADFAPEAFWNCADVR